MAGPSDELRAMYRRATAARDLAARGELDGEVALSYVIWPTPAMEIPRDRLLHADVAAVNLSLDRE